MKGIAGHLKAFGSQLLKPAFPFVDKNGTNFAEHTELET